MLNVNVPYGGETHLKAVTLAVAETHFQNPNELQTLAKAQSGYHPSIIYITYLV